MSDIVRAGADVEGPSEPAMTADEVDVVVRDSLKRMGQAREVRGCCAGSICAYHAAEKAIFATLTYRDRAPATQEAPSEPRRWHELKTDAAVFDAVERDEKRFEIRMDDRGFKVGDGLHLRETRCTGAEMKAGAPLEYTGRECGRIVTHVLRGPVYGLADGWVVLSVRPGLLPLKVGDWQKLYVRSTPQPAEPRPANRQHVFTPPNPAYCAICGYDKPDICHVEPAEPREETK